MANDYYTHGSTPATGSPGSSSVMRSEFDLIMAGFAKLPGLTGNGLRALVVNSGGTAVTLTTGTLTLGGAFVTAGGHSLTLTTTGITNVTLPESGTIISTSNTATLTNKTLTAPVLSGTVTGTYTLGGTPTISSPTISSPTLSGTTAGTYTLGGTPTITNATLTGTTTLTGGTLTGSSIVDGTLTGTTSITNGTLAGTTVVSGALDTSASGAGIIFPTLFGSPDSNTLFDYEVGGWTPSLGGTASYTFRVGRYIKIGKLVYVFGRIAVNTRGTGSQTTVSGLPFTTANTTSGAPGLVIQETTGLALSIVSVAGRFAVSGTTFFLYSRTAASTADAINNIITDSSTFSFSGMYEASS